TGDLAVLVLGSVALPVLALVHPEAYTAPAVGLLLVAAALPALLSHDTAQGGLRAARTAFGLLWLPVALSGLVRLGDLAVVVCVAVAYADVGGWCGGKALGRRGALA